MAMLIATVLEHGFITIPSPPFWRLPIPPLSIFCTDKPKFHLERCIRKEVKNEKIHYALYIITLFFLFVKSHSQPYQHEKFNYNCHTKTNKKTKKKHNLFPLFHFAKKCNITSNMPQMRQSAFFIFAIVIIHIRQ